MSDLQFYQTRAGRTYYEHTLPELIRQLERLNSNLERLAERMGVPAEGKKDRSKGESS